jgi:hypothetical protein
LQELGHFSPSFIKDHYLFANNPSVPFVIRADGEDLETPESLRGLLKGLRQIELQIQRDTDLETGSIQSPEEFQAHDEEWF